MQGKGAGPVNRVELESQVLCAALRQSCHVKDKIGAFTSVRELSHLFPDLLPPSEKDDEASSVNKDNFYAILRVKPQTAANGVLSAYLRAIRRFLKAHKVNEKRTDFNRILNAGFILRKPRLRLSHDLVVARRWLHEESRMAQVSQQEITTDSVPAYKPAAAAGAGASTSAPPAAASSPAQPLLKPSAAGPMPPPLPSAAPSTAPAASAPTPPPLPASGPTPPPLPASGPTAPPLPAASGPTPPPLPASGPTPPPLPAAAQSAPTPASSSSSRPPAPPLPPREPTPSAAPPLPVPEIAPPPSVQASPAASQVPAPPPLPQLSPAAAQDDGFTTAPTAIPVPANAVTAHEQAQPHSAVGASLAIAGLAPPLESGGIAGDESGIKSGAAPQAVPGAPKSLRAESYRPIGRDTLPLPPEERVAGQMPLTDDIIAPSLDEAHWQVESETAGAPKGADPAFAESAAQPPAPPAPPAAEPPAVSLPPEPPLPAPAPAAKAPAPMRDLMEFPPDDLDLPPAAPKAPAASSPSPAASSPPPPAASAAASAAGSSAAQAAASASTPAKAPSASPGDLMDFPPAAVRAQAAAAVPDPAPKDRPPGRISKEATFVFDESQLRKPVATGNDQIPMVVQLLEAAQVIGPLEVQALRAQMEFAPNIPVEKHILNAGYLTAAELASAKLGESLLQSGKISMAQFQVAFYDERFSGLRMAESLQVRGWLSVEVRNAIDDWQKKSQ